MEEERMNKKIFIAGAIIILFFSIAFAQKLVQNDIFYTLKIGEYISENGITNLNSDNYSWYEGLPYTYPHWLYDLMMFGIFSIGQWDAIYVSTIIFSFIVGMSLYFLIYKESKKEILSVILSCLGLFLLKGFLVARAQIITFSIFILNILFIEKFIETKKKRYIVLLALLSLITVNIHTAVWPFLMCLYGPYILEGITYLLLKKKKTEFNEIVIEYKPVKALLVVLGISIVMGFINPAGLLNGFSYLINTLRGPTLSNIVEHLPAEREGLIYIYAFTMLPAFIICLTTKVKIKLHQIIIYFVGFALSLTSKRQLSLNVIFALYLYGNILSELINEYFPKTTAKIYKIANMIYVQFFVVIIMALLSYKIFEPELRNEYYTADDYPIYAVEWIKENLDTENIRLYNTYNIGSFLLYNDIKPFFDSRADLYTKEFNHKEDLFSDGLHLERAEYIEDLLEKYKFTHFLVRFSYPLYNEIKTDEYHFKLIYPTEKDIVENNYFKLYEVIRIK